jgi:hypothetical protein
VTGISGEDHEGGQGPCRTVEPEEEQVNFLAKTIHVKMK